MVGGVQLNPLKGAREFAEANLLELVKEVVSWDNTGVLEGNLLKTMAQMVPDKHHGLSIAKDEVTWLVMKKVASGEYTPGSRF